MLSRRSLFWLLAPIGFLGGAAMRAVEKAQASPLMPKKYRQPQLISYYWTDGTEVWASAYDVPADVKNVRLGINLVSGPSLES